MSGNFTHVELVAAANDLCRKHWGVDFTGKIELINARWRCMNAQYRWRRDDPTFQLIRMSKFVNRTRSKEQVIGTLLHELVHWRLHSTGVPHRDDNQEFVRECIRVGASISGTEKAKQALSIYKQIRGYEERTGKKYEEG